MRAEPLTIGSMRCRESEQEQRQNSKYVLSLSVVWIASSQVFLWGICE